MLRRKVGEKGITCDRNIVWKTVNMCRCGKLIDCFQLVFLQKSYVEATDDKTLPFLFILYLV